MKKEKLAIITKALKEAGLSGTSARTLTKLAAAYDGFFDLLQLWYEEIDPLEREKILVVLVDCLLDRCGHLR